jgi:hypothetical protein
MSFQVGRGCLPLIITRQRLSDTCFTRPLASRNSFAISRPGRDCFSRVVSVLEGILVTLRGARGHPAVHPAAAVRHRRRPAPAPSPCPRSTPPAEVHGQFVLHGVDPLISVDPLPGVVAHYNLDQAALDAYQKIWPMQPDNTTVTGQTILERKVVHVPDVE